MYALDTMTDASPMERIGEALYFPPAHLSVEDQTRQRAIVLDILPTLSFEGATPSAIRDLVERVLSSNSLFVVQAAQQAWAHNAAFLGRLNAPLLDGAIHRIFAATTSNLERFCHEPHPEVARFFMEVNFLPGVSAFDALASQWKKLPDPTTNFVRQLRCLLSCEEVWTTPRNNDPLTTILVAMMRKPGALPQDVAQALVAKMEENDLYQQALQEAYRAERSLDALCFLGLHAPSSTILRIVRQHGVRGLDTTPLDSRHAWLAALTRMPSAASLWAESAKAHGCTHTAKRMLRDAVGTHA